jgi:predicted ATP-grasp superfamily ATP-dependent carboligase
LAETILGIESILSVLPIYALVGFVTGVFAQKSRVFCTASDMESLRDINILEIDVMDRGAIKGMNGPIVK